MATVVLWARPLRGVGVLVSIQKAKNPGDFTLNSCSKHLETDITLILS